MVGAVGIEPTTPSMSPRCSPAELCALIVESDMTNEASFLAPTAVFGKWLLSGHPLIYGSRPALDHLIHYIRCCLFTSSHILIFAEILKI